MFTVGQQVSRFVSKRMMWVAVNEQAEPRRRAARLEGFEFLSHSDFRIARGRN